MNDSSSSTRKEVFRRPLNGDKDEAEEATRRTTRRGDHGGDDDQQEASLEAVSTQRPTAATTSSASSQTAALDEAQAVLDAIGGDMYLDGFNLLQVIANPWGTTTTASASAQMSYHGRYNSGAMTSSRHGSHHGLLHNHPMTGIGGGGNTSEGGATSATALESSTSDFIQETYHQLENTVVQVTEQMEALNLVLEDWSRHLYEDDNTAGGASSGGGDEDALPESQLEELPAHLQNLDLGTLQMYLERSGMLAHAFQERHPVVSSAQQQQQQQQTDSSLQESQQQQQQQALVPALQNEIPEVFWRQGPDALDLTDPETFQSLFLTEEAPPASASPGTDDDDNDNDVSVYTWFPLVPPDALNTGLDKVEIALLEAVRNQSGAFFEESIRFATLQQVIESLLQEVQVLQQRLDRIMGDDYLQPLLQVPEWDERKADYQALVALLDRASELLRCKQSIAGFLAAADDKTALEQIQYARRQLTTQQSDDNMNVCLNQLTAFSSVARQLDQYEQLIVTNLREELVEVFLDWKPAVPSATAISPSSGGGGGGAANLDRVRDIMSALRHCHALRDTRTAYNNRLQDVLRLTVRTVVGEFAAEQQQQSSTTTTTTTSTTTSMTLERFLDCFDLTAEQLLSLLQSASQVDLFCVKEGFTFNDESDDESDDQKPTGSESPQASSEPETTPAPATTPMSEVIVSAAELSSKSMSELLRLRKEAHSLVTLEEMKRIWDKCLSFTTQLEALSGGRTKATALRSTLLAQAKAFCDRQHDSNMSALVAALDSERWTQCEVSAERQAGLTRLCSGRSVWSSPLISSTTDVTGTSSSPGTSLDRPLVGEEKKPQVEVEGIRYKVVWSCLLLVEMIQGDLAAAAHFHSLASSVVSKVAELLRLFNSRTTQLVLGAGAIHSAARLKSINAKHLSLVTQCLGLVIAILPHVRASLMAQMPAKQHTLLNILDQIKREYADHNEKVLNKFVTIIGSIVEHGLTPKLSGTDFDKRAAQQQENAKDNDESKVSCCVFLEGVSTNTRKMHQVLFTLLPPEHLQDVFSRIFAFVDQKIPTLLVAMDENEASTQTAGNAAAGTPQKAGKAPIRFSFPTSDAGKRQLLLEVECMTENLNGLDGVQPWDFSAVTVLEKKLEYTLESHQSSSSHNGKEENGKAPSELDSEAETDVTTDPGDADEHSATHPDSPPLQSSSPTPVATSDNTSDVAPADVATTEVSEDATTEAPTTSSADGPTSKGDATDEEAAEESKAEAVENGGSDAVADQDDYPAEITAL